MAAIEEGGKLPALELATPGGGHVNLRDYLGKPFALYFYPKDDTSACTKEAQDFSRLYPEFQEIGGRRARCVTRYADQTPEVYRQI